MESYKQSVVPEKGSGHIKHLHMSSTKYTKQVMLGSGGNDDDNYKRNGHQFKREKDRLGKHREINIGKRDGQK